jgi:hypothetical protein
MLGILTCAVLCASPAQASGKFKIDRHLGGRLYTTTAAMDVLAEPKSGSKTLQRYQAGAIMAVIGEATGTDYLYVSPCNACENGFVAKSIFMSNVKR